MEVREDNWKSLAKEVVRTAEAITRSLAQRRANAARELETPRVP